jgi:hypothetical protein
MSSMEKCRLFTLRPKNAVSLILKELCPSIKRFLLCWNIHIHQIWHHVTIHVPKTKTSLKWFHFERLENTESHVMTTEVFWKTGAVSDGKCSEDDHI